ncbi:fimbrial protein, partial [Vibrio jasicida]|uniref:fimbrial protein n=1 Tax=Vibrio jasicida TaxID=766224 RepID=UPI00358E25AA
CSADADKVAAYFQAGATVDPSTGRLVNKATTDAATNVDLQLSEADGTVIKAGDSTQVYQTVDASAGSATLNYGVEYFATGQSTAGAVDSSVIYSLSYN